MVDPNNLHHAYVLPGASEADVLLDSIFLELGVKKSGNPDFFAYRVESFGVDEARELSDRASRKAFGERKVFVIATRHMTREAQNALLKTLEDPYEHTHFFVRIPEEQMLIPTLLSRVHILKSARVPNPNIEEAEKFLSLPLVDRLTFAKKFADDQRAVSPFLDSVLNVLRSKESPLEKLDKVFTLRKFADDRSASTRLLLEHLSLVI